MRMVALRRGVGELSDLERWPARWPRDLTAQGLDRTHLVRKNVLSYQDLVLCPRAQWFGHRRGSRSPLVRQGGVPKNAFKVNTRAF